MAVKISFLNTHIKSRICLLLIFLILAIYDASASDYPDTTKKRDLASPDKNSDSAKIPHRASVVFPEILKGNEEEASGYIEKFSRERRNYLVHMYNKGKNFLLRAAAILQKYNLPAELKILLILESAYNGNAISKAGAVGYWQIMDVVAKEYGMKYNARLSRADKKKLLKANSRKRHKLKLPARQNDDRKNFNIATNAAARYLRDRRRNLDDNWLLIVASYNCGVGNVWRAMKKSGKANPGFWDIKKYLPAETRAYVMNFITLNVIFHNYEKFAKNMLSFAPVKIKTDNFENDEPEESATTCND